MGLTRRRATRHCRAIALLLGAALAGPTSAACSERRAGIELQSIASEAREAIAVIDWFYVQHRACPQPSRPEELAEMQSELGDGFSVEKRGEFVEIRGISMLAGWLYYTSPRHPERCTLWRKLGWDPALIWRRHSDGARWALDPGDGGAERPVRLDP